MSALQHVSTVSSLIPGRWDLLLPPVRSVAKLGSNGEQAIAITFGSQLQVTKPAEGISIAITLLEAFSCMRSERSPYADGHSGFSRRQQWALDAAVDINRSLMRIRATYDSDQTFSDHAIELLHLVRGLCSPSLKPTDGDSSATTETIQLCHCIVIYFHPSMNKPLALRLQKVLASYLATSDDGLATTTADEILCPSLSLFAKQSEVFTSSSTELQYACLLYTSPSPRDGLLSRMPSSA